MRYILCLIFFFNFQVNINGQQRNCDFRYTLKPGEVQYLYSKDYRTGLYPPGWSCRWQAQCPSDSVCRFRCHQMNIPGTPSCNGDRLLVSVDGNPNLLSAQKFCGNQILVDVVSRSNKISIGFISAQTSPGGKFSCTITAQPKNNNACQCGWKKDTRIVGGIETKENEFPMMVGLVDFQLRIVFCGGTIISNRWVLTAAHCLSTQIITNVIVYYEGHNIKKSSPYSKIVRANSFFIHPGYRNNKHDNDIALIRTVSNMNFNERVGPACLPFKYLQSSMDDLTVKALGWGSQSFAGAVSDYLQKVDLGIITSLTCSFLLRIDISDNIICTYSAGRKDTCQFDSGGPLLYQDLKTGRLYIVGIIIAGYGCASGRPSINLKVSNYLDWIINVTSERFCNI